MGVQLSNERGFIALHRKIFENPIVGGNPEYFRAWIWLLCEAKYKPTRQRLVAGRAVAIDLQTGQLSHSRSFIAKALGVTEQRVRTFLNRLKIEGMILVSSNQGQMVITICNWADYQIDLAASNQRSNRQLNQQSTSNQPELNKVNNNSLGEAPKKPKRQGKKLGPPPEDGTPEFQSLRAGFLDYGKSKSFSPSASADEFESFLSHHRAKGTLFADWTAAGQNWLRNSLKFSSGRSGHPSGRRPDL